MRLTDEIDQKVREAASMWKAGATVAFAVTLEEIRRSLVAVETELEELRALVDEMPRPTVHEKLHGVVSSVYTPSDLLDADLRAELGAWQNAAAESFFRFELGLPCTSEYVNAQSGYSDEDGG